MFRRFKTFLFSFILIFQVSSKLPILFHFKQSSAQRDGDFHRQPVVCSSVLEAECWLQSHKCFKGGWSLSFNGCLESYGHRRNGIKGCLSTGDSTLSQSSRHISLNTCTASQKRLKLISFSVNAKFKINRLLLLTATSDSGYAEKEFTSPTAYMRAHMPYMHKHKNRHCCHLLGTMGNDR